MSKITLQELFENKTEYIKNKDRFLLRKPKTWIPDFFGNNNGGVLGDNLTIGKLIKIEDKSFAAVGEKDKFEATFEDNKNLQFIVTKEDNGTLRVKKIDSYIRDRPVETNYEDNFHIIRDGGGKTKRKRCPKGSRRNKKTKRCRKQKNKKRQYQEEVAI